MLYGLLIAAAVEGIWKGDLVVRFLPLSFYAKKKVAERKARIRGGGAKDARIREHMAAPVPLLCISPYDCSADIWGANLYPKRSPGTTASVSKKENHVLNFSFSRLQSVYTRS